MISISIFAKKTNNNYLDFIPVRSNKISWEVQEDLVTIIIERKGFFDKVAQVFFKRPKKSFIQLDEMSSYTWLLIDGNRNVNEIAELFKEKFKDNAEPLYDRIVKFFTILQDNKFISYK